MPKLNGNIDVSQFYLNKFFEQRNLNVYAHKEIGRGSFGCVFQGTYNDRAIVIKTALSKPSARHSLKEEMEIYRRMGMFKDRRPDLQPSVHDAIGHCYYYGAKYVDKHESLDCANAAEYQEMQRTARSRSARCVELGRFQKSSSNQVRNQDRVTGVCSLSECKFCRKRQLILHVMIMSRFGSSIRQLQKTTCKQRTFTTLTVAKLLIVGLSKLQSMHEKGVVHRDLKPNNMAIPWHNPDATFANMYYIDMGLSKPWRDKNDGHIPDQMSKRHTGTIYYIGIDAHEGHDASRRDDIQALGIIALDLLVGDLPWEEHQHRYRQAKGNRSSAETSVYQLKLHRDKAMLDAKKHFIRNIHHEKQVSKVPHQFKDFVMYGHSLTFTEAPDYEYWIQCFVKYVDAHRGSAKRVDWMFDTRADARKKNESSHLSNSSDSPNSSNYGSTNRSPYSRSSIYPSSSERNEIVNDKHVKKKWKVAPRQAPPPPLYLGLKDFQPAHFLQQLYPFSYCHS